MSWIKLDLSSNGQVTMTARGNRVVIGFGSSALRNLSISSEAPVVSVSIGDGEDVGWLRIAAADAGTALSLSNNGATLTLPRSVLPEVTDCRSAPLAWRWMAGALEVRLPAINARRSSVKPKLVVSNQQKAVNLELTENEGGVEVITPPDLYKGLHAQAWAVGIELMFLSDGNCVVNGKVVPIEEMEATVMARIKAA